MSQPDYHAVLQDFFQWESQSWVEVVTDITTDEKDCFMPVEALRSYLKANGSRKLIKILSEIFHSDNIPVSPELILRGHTAVFCILLRVGKGRYIEHFVRYEELSDYRLPFDPNHAPTCFPVATDDPSFLRRFCEKQWMYCVPIFDHHMQHKHFGRLRLLPITHKERRGGGGSAIIYKIKIYGPHNKLLPAGSEMQLNNTNPNTFILKRYLTKEAEDHYTQEVNGFRSLKHPDSIIRFYGSYIHGENYNVLLEYADKGSLEEYFQRESPPSRGGDIIKFWDGLFQLIKALKAIHSILGLHQDVKPANVLVLSYGAESPFFWQFKLADFGLSQFISKEPQDGDLMANDARGTRTYGAPECYMPYNLDDQIGRSTTRITQAVDIWSLGCIYSEAAMWIADGYKGVVDYRHQRMAETDKILNFKGGDCFHDGEKVLRAVLEAHRDIEARLRLSDYITKDVLDTLVGEMLWEEDRPNAKALWRKADGALARARLRLSSNAAGDFFRTPLSRSLTFPPQNLPLPPPELPRGLPPGLSSFSEQQIPTNVQIWRTQVSGSQASGPVSGLASTVYSRDHRNGPDSIWDFDREPNDSIGSWPGGDNSTMASPITSSYASPHRSLQTDNIGHMMAEGRPLPLQSRRSSNHHRPDEISHGQSYMGPVELSDNRFAASNVLASHPEFLQEGFNVPTSGHNWHSTSITNESGSVDDSRTIGQGSQHLSESTTTPIMDPTVQDDSPPYYFSPDDVQIPIKSPKRSSGFPLFSSTTPRILNPNQNISSPISQTSTDHHNHLTNSEECSSYVESPIPSAPSTEYLSLSAALEWKRAQKKSWKSTKISPLPGASLLDRLKDRDHVFLIDDGLPMQDQWPDVKRVFEALSYIVKPMSRDGTELYFTVSYDTWRRKDTSELCGYLEKKEVAGQMNISYRLNLQLQSYKAKLQSTPRKAAKSKHVRPMSVYILSNGDWSGGGSDPKSVINDVAEFLIQANLKSSQLVIQLISFAKNAAAVQRMDDLAKADFGLDILDCTPWTGNVLKMLLGALDKSLFRVSDNQLSNSVSASAPSVISELA